MRTGLPRASFDRIASPDLLAPGNLAVPLEHALLVRGETVPAKERPVVIVTSNTETGLPGACLRR